METKLLSLSDLKIWKGSTTLFWFEIRVLKLNKDESNKN
jgi:hypothetical protein